MVEGSANRDEKPESSNRSSTMLLAGYLIVTRYVAGLDDSDWAPKPNTIRPSPASLRNRHRKVSPRPG